MEEYLHTKLKDAIPPWVNKVSRDDVVTISRDVASRCVAGFYEVTFRGVGGPPFSNIFLTCFCTHEADEAYEKRHGLLSQWRAYGRNERFALVFRTSALVELMRSEERAYDYLPGSIIDVVYSNELAEQRHLFETAFESAFSAAKAMFENDLEISSSSKDIMFRIIGEAYFDFVRQASRYKHEGFKEEREVRIVANPSTPELHEYVERHRTEGSQGDAKPFKTIYQDDSRRYIALFDSDFGLELPIDRIIVGPSVEKAAYAEKARQLVGSSIKVDVSETPFVG